MEDGEDFGECGVRTNLITKDNGNHGDECSNGTRPTTRCNGEAGDESTEENREKCKSKYGVDG